MYKKQLNCPFTILGAALLLVLLAGCGQKGELYLPDEQAAAQSPQQAARLS